MTTGATGLQLLVNIIETAIRVVETADGRTKTYTNPPHVYCEVTRVSPKVNHRRSGSDLLDILLVARNFRVEGAECDGESLEW
jgi:hypothetical protein